MKKDELSKLVFSAQRTEYDTVVEPPPIPPYLNSEPVPDEQVERDLLNILEHPDDPEVLAKVAGNVRIIDLQDVLQMPLSADASDALTLDDVRLDVSKLRLGTEGDIYYDDEYMEEFSSDILIENAWFCGCGCSEEAASFFFAQLAALAENRSLFTFEGGLDFFKVCCYERGILDGGLNFTEKGKQLIELAKFVPDPENLPEKLPVPDMAYVNDPGMLLSVLFDRTQKPIPSKIDKMKVAKFMAPYMSFLKSRDHTKTTLRDGREGEWYLIFYALEAIFDIEEHGGTTPGWLTHGNGDLKMKLLEETFGVSDFFQLYVPA